MIKYCSPLKISIITLIIISCSSLIVNANHFSSTEDLPCTQVSLYYDTSLSDVTPGSIDEDSISKNCNEDDYDSFPSAYNNEDFTNIANSIKTSNQPITYHTHIFTNTTEEEKKSGKTTYHLFAVDKFEFQLEEDFMENIKLNSVECNLLSEGNNCDEEGSLGTTGTGLEMGFETSFKSHF